jgi:type I restriction enzyme S subunit
MEVRPGYKQTEVGAIPDDWDCVRICDLARLESGHTPRRTVNAYWNGPIPWVSLHDTDSLDQNYICDTVMTVTQQGIDNSSARVLPAGTVVFSRTATVGKAAILGRAMATSQDFANYVCGPKLFNLFVVYLFRGMARTWDSLMAGSTHKTVYMPTFENLRIPVPSVSEQQGIAAALADVDNLLDGLDRLIAKKRDLKQAAMQQLLTSQTRLPGFDGEWKPRRFSELLKYERPDQYTVTSTDYEEEGDTPVLTANKSFVLGYTSETFGVFDSLPVIIFDDFTTDSKYVEFPFKVKSSAIKILKARSPEANLKFVAERMRLLRFPVGEHKRYYISEYQYVELPTPGPDEQTAIAAVLSDMDAELAALEARRDKTRDLKQAMMQELLTGKTRLVPAGTAHA